MPKTIFKRVLWVIVVLLLVATSIDLIRLAIAWDITRQIAYRAARYAATGQYRIEYCQDLDGDGSLCSGKSKDQEVDIARVQSIHHIADIYQGFLGFNYSNAWNQPGYLRVTVCSSPRNANTHHYRTANPIANFPQHGGFSATTYGSCTLHKQEVEDPGFITGYRDRDVYWVTVMVDYNNPLWLFPLRIFWPYYHLAVTQEAIVEKWY